MPTAGDEGYETLIICPYDRSHEIRRGRIQFHLDKCRKNFPEKSKEMVQCPFNSTHLIPRYEENYHTQEECNSRANFDRHTHEIGDTDCTVKDLVPVNGYTSSVDADENWDDFEAQGSVLNIIRQNAEEKPVLRMMQCESKAKRKNFRLEERRRYNELLSNSEQTTSQQNPSILEEAPLRRPITGPSIRVRRQDPKEAAATLGSHLKSMDLKENSAEFNPPKQVDLPATSSASSSLASHVASPLPSTSSSRPPSTGSYVSARQSPSVPGPLSQQLSYASASSMASHRPLSGLSFFSTSVPTPGDGFCQVPIPGLGRGSRRKNKD